MKSSFKVSTMLLLIGIASLIFQGCTKDADGSAPFEFTEIISVKSDGTTTMPLNSLTAVVTDKLLYEDEELEMLLYMKEEEKLARDVYTTLNQKWNAQIFTNISKAEQTHMNAVIFLLENYGEEYTQVKEAGIFTNPELQELYNQLTARGLESIVEAYKVGALIEEMDIKDLTDDLKIVTNENIKMVFENLLKGSRNHLRAFNRHIVMTGQTYTPQFITQDEYDQIVNAPHEKGNQYRMRRRGN